MATVCNIVGTILDSNQQPVSGKLVVVLDAAIKNEDSNPDSLLIQEPVEFTITNGVVDIDLLESETQRVTYWFRFYKLTGVSTYDTTPQKNIDFHAIVPDANTYEFSQLTPTGITTDNLSTGALKVAREIMINPTLANLVGQATKIYRGTTPPTTLIDNVLWIKDADRTSWFYDSADSRWESELITVNVSGNDITTNGKLLVAPKMLKNYTSIVLLGIRIRASVSSPNDGTNYWSFFAGTQAAAATTIATSTITYNTNSVGPSVIRDEYVPLNALVNLTLIDRLGVQFSKTGSPGDLDIQATFEYAFVYPV